MANLTPIGRVESPLVDRAAAPKQGDEGAPDAWILLNPEFAEAAADLAAGDDVFLLTWLDRADRTVLRVRPRGDPRNPVTGVFSTRSPDRPNPIGVHRVTILEVADPTRFKVSGLEAIHGTPVIDIKPVLRRERYAPGEPAPTSIDQLRRR
jgi:tRNA-Thr(GGU) m(6)t(6)A37 methyltransferase TsaA